MGSCLVSSQSCLSSNSSKPLISAILQSIEAGHCQIDIQVSFATFTISLKNCCKQPPYFYRTPPTSLEFPDATQCEAAKTSKPMRTMQIPVRFVSMIRKIVRMETVALVVSLIPRGLLLNIRAHQSNTKTHSHSWYTSIYRYLSASFLADGHSGELYSTLPHSFCTRRSYSSTRPATTARYWRSDRTWQISRIIFGDVELVSTVHVR